ncbi:MAG: 5'-methylthioadenosine/S-adenosylhomocysteine nucleosidase, partial [candidate division Zixibacteria bacterium]|nr:5'-methylthioadenosine/S-adenosylhomocysteine nucleosidase [candidate division Zixibacteria bacterium]
DPRLVKLACFAYDDSYKSVPNAPKLLVGSIVSGDRFVSDPRKIEWLQREFGAVATEMEGAAVGYTCFVNDVPFVIIRSISDSADSGAADEFDSFLVRASENSFKMVSSILEVMTYRQEAGEMA